MTTATPRPWRLRGNRDSTWMSAAERRRYAYVQIGKDDAYTTGQLEKADAALIVRAVNNYDALLKALQTILKDHDEVGGDCDRCAPARAALRALDAASQQEEGRDG